jgi:hypothetical protein
LPAFWATWVTSKAQNYNIIKRFLLQKLKTYTVDIFSGEPGESAQLRFLRFGRISSIVQPKNLLIWGNFAQNERNSPEIFGAKLDCADSPISGEKNNYCVRLFKPF